MIAPGSSPNTWQAHPGSGFSQSTKTSSGHATSEPVHVSAKSHVPVDARQTTPSLPATWPHAPSWHVSVVHGFSSSAQGLPFVSAWQIALQQSPSALLPSSHSSAGSRTPSPQSTPSAAAGATAKLPCPLPSSPLPLLPQDFTPPALVSADVWRSPAARAATPAP